MDRATEGAKFWLRVMNELKNRGISDILIAVVDGLKGFPEAITAVFPDTVVQTCIVHLIRHSLSSWRGRTEAGHASAQGNLRAADAEAGLKALEAFEAGPWGTKYPAIATAGGATGSSGAVLRLPRGRPPDHLHHERDRGLNAKLRRAVRTRGHFPNDDAATKLLYLVLDRQADEWKRPPREWFEARTQFAIVFGDRFVTQ